MKLEKEVEKSDDRESPFHRTFCSMLSMTWPVKKTSDTILIARHGAKQEIGSRLVGFIVIPSICSYAVEHTGSKLR